MFNSLIYLYHLVIHPSANMAHQHQESLNLSLALPDSTLRRDSNFLWYLWYISTSHAYYLHSCIEEFSVIFFCNIAHPVCFIVCPKAGVMFIDWALHISYIQANVNDTTCNTGHNTGGALCRTFRRGVSTVRWFRCWLLILKGLSLQLTK